MPRPSPPLRYCKCGAPITPQKGKAYAQIATCKSRECISRVRRECGALGGRPQKEVAAEVKEVETGEMSAFINRMCAHILPSQAHEDRMRAYSRMMGR